MNGYRGWMLSTLLLFASYASAQVINFDDVPDNTDIRTHYPDATFSCEGVHCANSSVWARQPLSASGQTAHSAPNVVALTKAPESPAVRNQTTGFIKVGLKCLATSVSVWGFSTHVPEPAPNEHAILVANDRNGKEVGEGIGTQYGQWESLMVSSPSNPIGSVFLGVEGTGVGAVAMFDDLNITCGPRDAFPPWYWAAWSAAGGVLVVAIAIFLWRRPR